MIVSLILHVNSPCFSLTIRKSLPSENEDINGRHPSENWTVLSLEHIAQSLLRIWSNTVSPFTQRGDTMKLVMQRPKPLGFSVSYMRPIRRNATQTWPLTSSSVTLHHTGHIDEACKAKAESLALQCRLHKLDPRWQAERLCHHVKRGWT